MRTLHVGLRVADRERSVAFYTGLGYEVIGSVPDTPIGHLTMLKLPDDEFVTIELVHDPTFDSAITNGLSHLVVQVESMERAIAELARAGIAAEEPNHPDGTDDFQTSIVVDPDGNRIELVQWPPGHPAGFTASDFSS